MERSVDLLMREGGWQKHPKSLVALAYRISIYTSVSAFIGA
jgi:hypothetical protein